MSETYVPTLELISAGELSGREALEYLRGLDQFVFHGSPDVIDELQPRQPLSHGKPDGEPAVCATTDIDQAIFRALINRRQDEKAGRMDHRSAWTTYQGDTAFLTTKSSYESMQADGTGYVYALNIVGFSPYRSEMRSPVAIKPDFSVLVSERDLPAGIHIFETEAEMAAALSEMRNRARTSQNNGSNWSVDEQGSSAL